MSLVNDMLRDLDRRKRHTSDGASLSYGAAEKVNREFPKWLKQTAPVAIGLVFGLIAAVLFFGNSDDADTQIRNSATELVAANNAQLPTQDNKSNQIASGAISIEEPIFTSRGYRVKIVSDEQFDFEIINRDEFGISLLLPGIESIENKVDKLPGFSVLNSSVGTNIYIETNDPTLFSVFEEMDNQSFGSAIVIEVEMTSTPGANSLIEESLGESLTAQDPLPESLMPESEPIPVDNQELDLALEPDTELSGNTIMETAPVRKPRELTFEERDQNVSQQASSQIQAGQLMSAYQILLEFIGENPEAHKSRVTLATLLFAQQEYGQANVVVDQGIALAPNFSGYKKIKSRILLLNNQPVESALVLEEFPPALKDDTEYFELLASSYQKSGEHLKAVKTYQDLIRHDSQQGRWWAALGISHEALGNAGDAVASYQAAMQLPNLESALRQYSQSRVRNLRN